MIKATCDRCGKDMGLNYIGCLISKDEGNAWSPILLISGIDPQTEKARNIDLCQDCEKNLYKFIFGEKVKTWPNQ